jgi:RNA polymerase sigma-70 factor (ECF subfamily)
MAPLCDAFLSIASAALRAVAAGTADLEGHLRKAVERARARWPAMAVPEGDFVRHLARHLEGESDLPGSLDALHIEDLFLALGCTLGLPEALARFEEEHIARLGPVLSSFPLGHAGVAEIQQTVRERLLVSTPERPARILGFGGRSPLWRWVRVVATRTAVDQQRAAPREVELDTALLSESDDLEIEYLRRLYGAEINDAFRQAWAALEPAQRTLLRQHVLDHASIDALAKVLQIHRATAARRLAKARADLVVHLRKGLRARLGVQRSTLDALLNLVRSRLDVELRASGEQLDPEDDER